MPSIAGILRLLSLGSMPETRKLVASAARSGAIRDLRRRSVRDPAGLQQDLRKRARARDLIRRAAGHPATRELATASLVFLPVRYMPVGLAASWAARKVFSPRLVPPSGWPARPIAGPTPRARASGAAQATQR